MYLIYIWHKLYSIEIILARSLNFLQYVWNQILYWQIQLIVKIKYIKNVFNLYLSFVFMKIHSTSKQIWYLLIELFIDSFKTLIMF